MVINNTYGKIGEYDTNDVANNIASQKNWSDNLLLTI